MIFIPLSLENKILHKMIAAVVVVVAAAVKLSQFYIKK